ncbi:MAG: hypothetical protein ACREA0_07735, partial [bacterium]
MERALPGRTWKLEPAAQARTSQEIKDWLVSTGGDECHTNNPHEVWRVQYSDATFTFYRTGTLSVTPSNDGALAQAHLFIDTALGPRFTPPSRPFVIGFDETGKGEVLGHVVLVGAAFGRNLYSLLERSIGSADTKASHDFAYWDNVFRRIADFRNEGLRSYRDTIPPWLFDRFNINTLLDLTYQRMLLALAQHIDLQTSRIVIDDYGIGPALRRYLTALSRAGAEIVTTTKADNTYLESRVASLIAKHHQQNFLAKISKDPKFQLPGHTIGSGNAGDPRTVAWLRAWHASGRDWPWFVKTSFKTVREIEGRSLPVRKSRPPINDHLLSPEFLKRFEAGDLSVRSLSVICPSCGTTAQAVRLVLQGGHTRALCMKCRTHMTDLGMTLRYYCGRLLPDSNVLRGGFLGKDLQRSR